MSRVSNYLNFSGNAEEGIVLLGANGNQFIGNFIGVDKTFLHKLPNKLGVSIIAQSSGNLLQNNVILFNTQYGVRMIENGTSNNILKGNSIAYSDEGVFGADHGPAQHRLLRACNAEKMNQGLTCRRDPGRLEALTELLAGLRAVVGHRLGDELHAAHRLPGIDALLSQPALAPDLGA